ncbi:MAG: type II secretion system protein [Phycisphaerae bacterium]|nr:type II secretion system protein [Phycisphaerae bacterium]
MSTDARGPVNENHDDLGVVRDMAVSRVRRQVLESRDFASVAAPSGFVKAVTFVEVCVVLAILAIVLMLLMVSVRQVRDVARASTCQTHLRQLGGLLTLYTSAFRGYYPTFVADSEEVVKNPRWWAAYTAQSRRLFATEAWFRHSGIELQNPVYRCPANQFQTNISSAASDYLGVQVMHGDPTFFDSNLAKGAWQSRLAAEPQLIENVVFPSDKVGLWELSVWHGWRGKWIPGGIMRGLSFSDTRRASSMWFFDGHVEGLNAEEIQEGVDRRPVWESGKLYTTPDGVRGRDVLRGLKRPKP